jgi:hypothetical protein
MKLNDYLVPLEGLKVSVQTTFDSEDLSGETSSTAQAHKGIKPKEFSAGFIVAFATPDKLADFYAAAEAVTDSGDLVVYDITERTANAVNVRQVTFCGRIDTREADDLEAWRVSFRLKEVLSVAEKTEQRQEVAEAQPTTTEGEAVAAAPAQEQAEPLTGFEGILQKVDNALA